MTSRRLLDRLECLELSRPRRSDVPVWFDRDELATWSDDPLALAEEAFERCSMEGRAPSDGELRALRAPGSVDH